MNEKPKEKLAICKYCRRVAMVKKYLITKFGKTTSKYLCWDCFRASLSANTTLFGKIRALIIKLFRGIS